MKIIDQEKGTLLGLDQNEFTNVWLAIFGIVIVIFGESYSSIPLIIMGFLMVVIALVCHGIGW